MGYYKVDFKSSVRKDFRSIDRNITSKIWGEIEKLSVNPRPHNSAKLEGTDKSYRLKIGVYRVIYQIDDRTKNVVIIAVGHRREIYRIMD